MHANDPRLSELLVDLSEESLYLLLQLVEKRSRRLMLRAIGDGDLDDLPALRALQAGLQQATRENLRRWQSSCPSATRRASAPLRPSWERAALAA